MSIWSAARRLAGCIFAAITFSAISAVPAAAQVTSLIMNSDPGDYIGGGQTYNWPDTGGNIGASLNFQNGVTIYASYQGQWFNLYFSSPDRALLTPGTYSNATRWPFNPVGTAGIDISGNGGGCNQSSGSFTVLQATYDAYNNPTSFWATFEQHCENAVPALRGEIRYNANVALYLTAPATLQAYPGQTTRFTVTANDTQQRSVRLSATSLPPGATFQDLGNNTGTFTWTPTTTQLGSYTASFVGDNQAGNTAALSTRISVIEPPPPNDDIAHAQVITSLPQTMTANVTNATSNYLDPYCYGNLQSVWYAFTATTSGRVEFNTNGSNYDTAIGVYTGTPSGPYLNTLVCNGDTSGSLQSRVRFDAVAGTTYYVMVTSQYWYASNANLVLNVLPGPPALSFSANVQQFGTIVASTGQASILGTVTCNVPVWVTIGGSVRQVNQGVPINGYYNGAIPCDGVTSFSVPVTAYTVAKDKGRATIMLSAGKTEVYFSAYAFDPDTGEYKSRNFTATVQLRGK